MNDRNAPRLKKWPFYLADAVLLGLAYWVFAHFPHPLAAWAALLLTACVVVAALLAVWPFRLEYETEVRLFESGRITTAADAIRNLEDVAGKIQHATSQWQGVQDHAGRTTQSAREIAERMTTEARAFSEFMSKANDSEKSTLRLEVEKLRRSEGQWLQVLVHTLDHVHALYQAGSRSGQPNLAAQLSAFQGACRDLARRVGLVAVDAEIDQEFDVNQHEVVQGQPAPEGPAQIAQVVAPGYSFQGQILRRPVVVLKPSPGTETVTEAGTETVTETESFAATDNALGESPAPADSSDLTAHDVVATLPDTDETTDSNDYVAAQLANAESGEVIAEESAAVEEFRLEADPGIEEENRRASNG